MLSFKQYLNECSRRLVEAAGDKRFWFSAKTKKLVKVTTTYHDWEPVKNPEKFGLKRSQVLEFEADVEDNQDNIGGVMKLMIAAKWVRIIIQHFTSTGSWSIQSENLAQAAAAAKALSKKHEAPGRIFIDYGRKSAVLQGGQIDDFIRTGKIIIRTEIGATMARFR